MNIDQARDGRWTYHHGIHGDPIYVAGPGGENPQMLRRGIIGIHQHFTNWSPDGKWVYMSRGRPQTRDMDLWRISDDGEILEQLTENMKDVGYPTPLDDGRTVLFIGRAPDGAGPWLWAYDLESRAPRRISIGLERYMSIAASDDGKRLVATVSNPSVNLWSVPIHEKGRVAQEAEAERMQLANLRALHPRYGGGRLFFLSSRGARDGLWCRQGDDEVSELVSGTASPFVGGPAFSPDGERMVLRVTDGDRQTLRIMAANGRGARSLCEEGARRSRRSQLVPRREIDRRRWARPGQRAGDVPDPGSRTASWCASSRARSTILCGRRPGS